MPPSESIGQLLSFAADAFGAEQVRSPRLRVLVNGSILANAIEATVLSTACFAADQFRVHAALDQDAAVWASATRLLVDLQMSLSPFGPFTSLVQGYVDRVSIDPIAGTLWLDGRDRSAALIEARTQETFANRSSSDIATILATRRGLVPVVTPTAAPAGRYWELEHDSLTLNAAARSTTEWDLLVSLAKREGFDLWVSGETLNFLRPDGSAPPILLPMSALTSLRLEHELTFAGDIAVTVKSWHSRAGRPTVQTAKTERGAPSSRTYVHVAPNLTADAALAYAKNVLSELSAHELGVVIEMPGELMLSPRTQILLQGTGTIFDTNLRIIEIERRLHSTRGFSQRMRARAATAQE